MNFLARDVLYRRATLADDGALQSVLRQNPMDGWVRLSLQRAPSYFAGKNQMDRIIPVIASDQTASGRTVGMYDCSFPSVWINGVSSRTGYLGGLRINPRYRCRTSILKSGFASIPALLRDEMKGIPLWFTSIASDNWVARRILEASLNGMPRYYPVGELETLIVSTCQAKSGRMLRQATRDDIPLLADFHGSQAADYQFSACLSEHWLGNLCGANGLRIEDFWLLEDHGRVLACIALWDQRAFKQAVVHGYRFPLNYLRGVHNLAAVMWGSPSLPRPGARLESIFLSFFACTPAVSSEIVVGMIREALCLVKQRGAKLGVIGLSVQNRHLSGLRSKLRGIGYRSYIEHVTLHGMQPFILDQRPPQPEIAAL